MFASLRNSASLGLMHYAKKSLVQFIRAEGDIALFYNFGQRLLWKHRLVGLIQYILGPGVLGPEFSDSDLEKVAEEVGCAKDDLKLLAKILAKRGLLFASESTFLNTIDLPPLAKLWAERATFSARTAASFAQSLTTFHWCLINHQISEQNLISLEEVGFKRDQVRQLSLEQAHSAFLGNEELIVVFAREIDQIALLELNKRFHRDSLNWLVVQNDPFGFAIGPYLGREMDICYACLAGRRSVHIDEPEYEKVVANWAHEQSKRNKGRDFPMPSGIFCVRTF